MEKWTRSASCPLFHRPFRAKKRKIRGRFNARPPNHKIPVENTSENGAKKRKKRASERAIQANDILVKELELPR